MSFLTHLECSECGTRHDHRNIQSVCVSCRRPLVARYDLAAAAEKLRRGMWAEGPASLWRYRDLLPVLEDRNIVSLGEGWTPVLPLRALAGMHGVERLFLKDESGNATGSFKARGLCLAVSRARELGITEVCMPTAGNAGAALAAYGAAAGLRSHIFMPVDTPPVNIDECRVYGADVHLVPGLISDAGKAMNAHPSRSSWFDMSTLKEPYRLEGKKTLGFEIAEQFAWRLPDVIVYPTGGGTGLIGMWKAFAELQALGWLEGPLPKMVAVQAAGCAPIVRAFEMGKSRADFWPDAFTMASGLRVPGPFADMQILSAVMESNGCALAVDDEALLDAIRSAAERAGVLLCPEGAATLAALTALHERGIVDRNSSVLLFNTGSGLKYTEVLARAAAPE